MSKPLITEQNSISHRIDQAYIKFIDEGENNLFNCKTRLDNLNDLWSRYEKNYFEILSLSNSSKLQYIKDNTFDSVEQNYLKIKSKFNEFISKKERPSYPGRDNIHNSTVRNDSFICSEDSERLPRIPLPKFKGEYTEWETFRDLFTTLVVNKTTLSNVSKLHYLKTSLEGEALQLVSSFPVTGENFEIAWKKLVDKFENKRRLVSSHLASIFGIKAMKKESSAELKRILNSMNTPLQALELLHRDTNHWDDILVFHMVNLFHLNNLVQVKCKQVY